MIRIAHRGASGDYPENTLLAFGKALELGALWIELDVHVTADGQLVVIHDELLNRTTNGTGKVGDYKQEELKILDAGCGEKIPLLSEVFELIAGRAVINVELKGHGSAAPTALFLKEWFRLGRLKETDVLVSSLSLQELREFRVLQPDLRVAVVYDREPENLWQLVHELNVWSLHVDLPLVSEKLVERAHQRGLRLFVFTVNRPVDLRRLQQIGVDGIFTDILLTPER
ncbi:MAG TPA: glycerophosphodiester phosphodiesterase family protein [Geopsychrobacteraceae bacterium]|nr:glycerophosphodiester phosphodiesterase family protein [Geopsychrobacteraceae bacterium]